jgi:uncharacterized membrane protein
MELFKRRSFWILVAIFVFALGTRLLLAYSVGYFTGFEAYFHERQVVSVLGSGLPLFDDPLSFSGRLRVFAPVFDYLLSFFALFLGVAGALKLVPNFLMAFFVVLVYLITFKITRDEGASLVSAFSAGFIPVVFSKTLNSVSLESLMLPLVFYLIYCFMRADEAVFMYQFIVLSFILPLVSALSFFVVLGFLVYLFLIKLEYREQDRVELELVLFFTALVVWIELLIYKNAFLFHGYQVIWQNIPSEILKGYFAHTSVVDAVRGIGIVPLVFGAVAVYLYMFQKRSRELYLLVAFVIAATVLLWLRLINLSTGLMILGCLLVVLMGLSFRDLFIYVKKTKFAHFSKAIFVLCVVVIVATSFFPSLISAKHELDDSLSAKDVAALRWLEKNSADDSVVLGVASEGDVINAVALRKNVVDMDFFLIRQPQLVLDDVRVIYSTLFKTAAIELLDKYGVDYIYFSAAGFEFGVDSLKYADEDCFPLVYDDVVKIYQVRCHYGVSGEGV